MESKKIYQKLVAVQQDIDAITKNKKNKEQGYLFRSIDDVYNYIHPLLKKHSVICLPKTISSETKRYPGRREGQTVTHAQVLVDYIYATDDGSSVTVTMPGEALDYSDKAINKALAFAHKYAIIQMFHIPTEDNVDGDEVSPAASEGLPEGLKKKIENRLKKATNAEEVVAIAKEYPQLMKNVEFREIVINYRSKFTDEKNNVSKETKGVQAAGK